MHLFGRIANRLGRRWGIRAFPWADPLQIETGDADSVFDSIHDSNYWGDAESVSGGGSTKQRTSDYAERLVALLERRQIRSMFDAPCGDMNWMPEVIGKSAVAYSGGDISRGVLNSARKKFPDANLCLFDIRNSAFPDVQLWHCRDCLFHLSFEDGLAALRNFARSRIEYALITTNSGLFVRNIDILTGGHRVTDLERHPYNLGRPLERLRDYPDGEFPRYVALWRRSDIACALGVESF